LKIYGNKVRNYGVQVEKAMSKWIWLQSWRI